MLFAPMLAALVINVSTTADFSPTLIDRVLSETDAIWRPTGLSLIWTRQVPSAARPWLEVVFGTSRGSQSADRGAEPLGWIEFDGGVPKPQVYVSYANALDLLENSYGLVGGVNRMPLLQRETYVGRAMGRALAHEIGHYLFASKVHTDKGLMKATHTAWEFFAPEQGRFRLTVEERALVDARVAAAPLVAATTSESSSPTSRRRASPPPADPPSSESMSG